MISDIQIPGFRITEKVGDGGMSTVWKAVQVSLDRVVAIKVMSPKAVRTATDIKQFQFEAQAAAQLKHPGIVQVYDASIANGLYYMVMEYISGYTVGDWVRRKGRLSEADALLVAECVADALQYAWSQAGLIHCDVKPDNVIIDADGTVKVADLGLARTIHVAAGEGVPEEAMGTPNYISPEQSSGAPQLDCRTDIYALGAMLYHLVTGRMFFEGQDPHRIMDLQITDTVPDAKELVPQLSDAVCWLIEGMVAKERGDRPADWVAVQADLERVKRGEMPAHRLPAGRPCTMRRSSVRCGGVQVPPLPGCGRPAAAGRARRVISREMRLRFWVWAIVLIVCLGVGAALQRTGAGAAAVLPPLPMPETDDLRAQRRLAEAERWAAEHPDDVPEAIARFQRLRDEYQGDRVARTAALRMRQLQQAMDVAMQRTLAALDTRAHAALDAGRDAEAVEVYETYDGPHDLITLAARAQRADAMRRQIRERAGRQAAREPQPDPAPRVPGAAVPLPTRAALLDTVAEHVMEGRLEAAFALVQEALARVNDADREALVRVATMLREARGMEERLLRSFAQQAGQVVPVELVAGVRSLRIAGVEGAHILAQELLPTTGGAAYRDFSFALADVALRERLRRMGPDEWPDVALAKGLLARQTGALDAARKHLERCDAWLGPALAARLPAAASAEQEEKARRAITLLVQSVGIGGGAYDPAGWLLALRRGGVREEFRAQARDIARDVRSLYGATRAVLECSALLDALDGAASPPVP